ncbi:MAG: Calx-beta domain-containing protein [Chloroflexota bacterium]
MSKESMIHKRLLRLSGIGLLAVSILIAALAILPQSILAGTVSAPNCTEAGMIAQLTADGTAIFDASCDGAIITMTSELDLNDEIAVGDYVIDGNGFVTISMNGAFRHFAVDNASTSLELRNLTITGGAPGGAGGALEVDNGGTVRIINSTLIGNDAGAHGGAIDLGGNGILFVENSAILSNTSQNHGGAIRNSGGTLHIINSTLAYNDAQTSGDDGGALYVDGTSSSFITHTTIISNTALDDGGGFKQNATTALLNIHNSIVALNVDGGLTDPNCVAAASGFTSSGTNMIDADPDDLQCDPHFDIESGLAGGFAPLTDNGGDSTPHFPLLDTSPAVDGVTTLMDCSLTEDQIGTERPQDGDGNGSELCDIGAFELLALPTVSLSSLGTVAEADGTATITATLNMTHTQNVTISIATVDGTALGGVDFTGFGAQQLVFMTGVTQATGSVNVATDGFDEADETFSVMIASATNAITDAMSASTDLILEDSNDLTLTFANVADTEFNLFSGGFVVTATLNITSTRNVTYTARTVEGTATDVLLGGDDYNGIADSSQPPLNLTFTINSGELSLSGAFPAGVVVSDNHIEPTESFYLETLSTSDFVDTAISGTVTIINDDIPHLFISDTVASEAGGVMTFTVAISEAMDIAVTVDYTTSHNTTNNDDYTPVDTPQTITFSPMETEKDVVITLNNDGYDEEDEETFFVNLANATNAIITDNQGVGTIIDDDIPMLSVAYQMVTEGGLYTSTVTSDITSTREITFGLITFDITAIGLGTDYNSLFYVGSITVGQTESTVTSQTLSDSLVEGSETFELFLFEASDFVQILNDIGIVTIIDEDAPDISINSQSVIEGGDLVFTVSLTETSPIDVMVDYATADGTATDGTDYTGISGTLTIPNGSLTGAITVTTSGDLLDEFDETLTVTLSNPVNASLDTAVGTGTITDDDDEPTISVSDVSVGEADGTATFTVTLSAASGKVVTVTYQTTNVTALGGSDFTTEANAVVFMAGETEQTVNITINNDSDSEGNETFTLDLSDPINATLAVAQGTATIIDDDGTPPAASIDDVSVSEADGSASFTVTLDAAGSQAITIDYTTSDGTATAGSDYTTTSGTLSFSVGMTSQTIIVPITNDDVDEDATETFTVTLSNPSSVTLADDTGVGTINDDDTAGLIFNTGDGINVTEDGTNDNYQVSLTSQPTSDVTLTATSDNQTTLATTRNAIVLTFTSVNWNIPQTVNVSAVDDTLSEGPHTGSITHTIGSTDANYNSLSSSVLTVNITDNEQTFVFFPTVMNNFGIGPDLVVKDLVVTTSSLSVTIQNIGTGAVPADNGFWVNLFVNPDPVPAFVNDTWYNGFAEEGLEWGVDGAILAQLTPGGEITLTVGDTYNMDTGAFNNFDGLSVGDLVFIHVDAANTDNPVGGVLELHEGTSAPYNNISVFSIVTNSDAAGFTDAVTPTPVEGRASSSTLPTRPAFNSN